MESEIGENGADGGYGQDDDDDDDDGFGTRNGVSVVRSAERCVRTCVSEPREKIRIYAPNGTVRAKPPLKALPSPDPFPSPTQPPAILHPPYPISALVFCTATGAAPSAFTSTSFSPGTVARTESPETVGVGTSEKEGVGTSPARPAGAAAGGGGGRGGRRRGGGGRGGGRRGGGGGGGALLVLERRQRHVGGDDEPHRAVGQQCEDLGVRRRDGERRLDAVGVEERELVVKLADCGVSCSGGREWGASGGGVEGGGGVRAEGPARLQLGA